MANTRHLWEELADLSQAVANQAPRLMILCVSARLRYPEQPDCHREDRDWKVVVVKGRGFYKDPMSGQTYEPFTDSVETIRDLMRTMLGISDDEEMPNLHYLGWNPLPSILPTKEANAFADAIEMNFRTGNDIPAIVEEAPGTGDEGTLPGE